jgi:5-methylcytosine-specific restriction endonuclease McrA
MGTIMMRREYRRMAYTEEERDRLSRQACPVCGIEREKFKPRNRNAVCCCPEHSNQYWNHDRPTIAGMRRRVQKEQNNNCASCGQDLHEGWYEKEHRDETFILDHIIPIAMGGDQWARENLQCLCEKCNKWKTAKDMGRIAQYRHIGKVKNDTHQLKLFSEALS